MKNVFIFNFVAALAAISSLATLIGFTFHIDTQHISLYYSGVFMLAILIICTTYAYCQSRRKQSIELSIKNINISIKKGDIFQCSGKIVIPVNEYFDTIVDNIIVSENTLHGKFIKKIFANRVNELDSLISVELQKNRDGVSNDKRETGNKMKYPLGTCIEIKDNNVCYILVALTHFDDNNHAIIESDEFSSVIHKLFDFCEMKANNVLVNMPILGTGQSGIRKEKQRILHYILYCLEFTSSIKLPAGLNIIIYNSDIKDYNLNIIEKYYK